MDRDARTRPPVRPDAPPRILVAKEKGALRLQAVSVSAGALGLHPGLSLADARGRVPELDVGDADTRADGAFLEALGEWARRWTPSVALVPPDALTLDITGVAHLSGGEAAMVEAVAMALGAQRVTVSTAIADTPGAAWALARFAPETIAPPGSGPALVEGLPVAALQLDATTLRLLDRLGLRRIGQLLAAPRPPLMARFGADLLAQLDEAVGRERAPLTLKPEAVVYCVERVLPEPISAEAHVMALAGSLARDLEALLEANGLGGRAFTLALFRADGAVKNLDVTTSRPVRNNVRIAKLFAERLGALNEGLEADYGFDRLVLTARIVSPLTWQAQSLDANTGESEALAALTDRIGARLGPQAVRVALPGDSWQPEHAVQSRSPLGLTKGRGKRVRWDQEPPAALDGIPLRPTRLLTRPEAIEVVAAAPEGAPARFRWRRVPRTVIRAEGPERLAGDMWGGEPGLTRDYYRVEDNEGRRYWLFRQGLYGRETAAPEWYLHGLFS